MTSFHELHRLLTPQPTLQVVDVGANPIDGDPPYRKLLSAGLCEVTGFEPQPEALAQLQRTKGPAERYLPYVIGDGEQHTLRICYSPGMSGLYKPDRETLQLFRHLWDCGVVKEELSVETVRLDDVGEIAHCDFLKIDVQGSELSVFRGAKARLAKAVAIQTEVSFIALYEGQPVFGEIDLELRDQGFVPHCFANIKKWAISPMIVNNDPFEPLNQLLEADIVYVRDLTKLHLLDSDQLKHLALIAHACYQSYDLALRCILLLATRKDLPSDSYKTYAHMVEAVDGGAGKQDS